MLFVVGLKRMQSPATAVAGNRLAAAAMLIAIVATFAEHRVVSWAAVLGGLAVGSLVGATSARLVKMTAMPEMVALFNGAGGGVGTIAIQLAKLQDVEVTGVDSAAKLEMMRSLGFDHVIDYTTEDFTRNGRRYDLILDTKTTRSAFAYARSLNPRGTYATVGGPEIARLLWVAFVGGWIGVTTDKAVRLIGLRQNRDLPYLNERF